MKIIVFGEIIWDVYENERTIGGAPFNFAANLGHLGDDAYLISAVGEDELGKEAFMWLRRHRVKPDLVQKNHYDTGRCLVTLEGNGIPRYQVLRDVAYDHITADEGLLEQVRMLRPEALYFGTLCQRGNSAEALKALLSSYPFREVFCDINIREGCSDRETTRRCLENATLLKISEEEAHFIEDYGLVMLSDKPLEERLAERYPGLKQIIITLGKRGSRVYETASGRYYKSGDPGRVEVVSTVGAGDCYGASYLHAYMSGASIPDAIAMATERSNVVVGSYSAVPFGT